MFPYQMQPPTWDVDRVAEFLDNLACPQAAEKARIEKLDGRGFSYLCYTDALAELGIESRLEAWKIMEAFHEQVAQEMQQFSQQAAMSMEFAAQQPPTFAFPPPMYSASWAGQEWLYHPYEDNGMAEPCSQRMRRPRRNSPNMWRSAEQASEQPWLMFKDLLQKRGHSFTDIEKQGRKREKLLSDKSGRRAEPSSKSSRETSREVSELSCQIRSMVSALLDLAVTPEVPDKNEVVQFVLDNVEELSLHPLGSEFVKYFLIRAQSSRLLEVLAENVVRLAKNRWGTEVVQEGVKELPAEQKRYLVSALYLELQGKDAVTLLEHPDVSFCLRACFQCVADGHWNISFVDDILTAIASNLDKLFASASDFRYAYKLIMWALECCSTTDSARERMTTILEWCSNRVKKLTNHKFGNILLQHVLAYGGKGDHTRAIAQAALDSMSEFLKADEGKEKWFAANVIQTCCVHMKDDEWFGQSLMDLVQGDGNSFTGLQKLWQNNKFTARRIFEMSCWSSDAQQNMKAAVKDIDQLQCEAKVNYGFTSSLFFRSWSSFGASAEQTVEIGNIGRDIDDTDDGEFRSLIFGLPVPQNHANSTLAKLELGPRYHMTAFGMETADGVSTNLGAQTALVKGATLWVAFQNTKNAPAKVEEFLGYAPKDLRARWLTLCKFSVSAIPAWIDQDILSTKLRAKHGITMYGIFDPPARIDGTPQTALPKKTWTRYPQPKTQLSRDSIMLVLKSDTPKLKEIAKAMHVPAPPGLPPREVPYCTESKVHESDDCPNPEALGPQYHVSKNGSIEAVSQVVSTLARASSEQSPAGILEHPSATRW